MPPTRSSMAASLSAAVGSWGMRPRAYARLPGPPARSAGRAASGTRSSRSPSSGRGTATPPLGPEAVRVGDNASRAASGPATAAATGTASGPADGTASGPAAPGARRLLFSGRAVCGAVPVVCELVHQSSAGVRQNPAPVASPGSTRGNAGGPEEDVEEDMALDVVGVGFGEARIGPRSAVTPPAPGDGSSKTPPVRGVLSGPRPPHNPHVS